VSLLGLSTYSAPPPPAIHDGDTLTLHGERIRLWGADAPELRQTCPGVQGVLVSEESAGGAGAPAGLLARDALAALVVHGVRCERAAAASWGRTVARCTTGGADVGAAMVRAGWAWDTPYSGGAYADEEREARETGRGVWALGCVRAEAWRARQ